MRRNKGFTLIELAIVLVIIGIILGAVLKGQELINNAKVKRLQNDVKGLEALIWTFRDRYGRFPGDCDSNGYINAYINSAVNNSPTPSGLCSGTSDDGDYFWNDLRWAELLPKSAQNTELSKHIFDSVIRVGRASNGLVFANAIAIYLIPCYAAKALDVSIDGAVHSGQGRIRRWVSGYTYYNSSTDDWNSACSGGENTLVGVVYLFDRVP